MIVKMTREDLSNPTDREEIYYDTLNSTDELARQMKMLFIHLQEIEDMSQRAGESKT